MESPQKKPNLSHLDHLAAAVMARRESQRVGATPQPATPAIPVVGATPSNFLADPLYSATTKLILMVVRHQIERVGWCKCNASAIARMVGCNRKTAYLSVSQLLVLGLLERKEQWLVVGQDIGATPQ